MTADHRSTRTSRSRAAARASTSAGSSASRARQAPSARSTSPSSSARSAASAQVKRLPPGFGRMPSHWGTSMFINDGNCLDCDYGVNADRVMFATKLFNHFLVASWDWVASGPTTRLYNPNQTNGPAYNADPIDDVTQWVLALGRQDKPDELEERVVRGDVVINYGGYFVYRRQTWDEITNPAQNLSPTNPFGAIPGGQTAARPGP